METIAHMISMDMPGCMKGFGLRLAQNTFQEAFSKDGTATLWELNEVPHVRRSSCRHRRGRVLFP